MDQDIVQAGQQTRCHLCIEAAFDKGCECLLHLPGKINLTEVVAGNTQDPGIRMEQTFPVQLIKRRKKFAAGKITKNPEYCEITCFILIFRHNGAPCHTIL